MTNIDEKLERLIDANLNRLKEGIRVIEDINRYIYEDKSISSSLKDLRHELQLAYNQNRLNFRDIEGDILKESTNSEMIRENIDDLIIANFSRSQESARVLEECFKLTDTNLSNISKNIRYRLYNIEKLFFINRKSK